MPRPGYSVHILHFSSMDGCDPFTSKIKTYTHSFIWVSSRSFVFFLFVVVVVVVVVVVAVVITAAVPCRVSDEKEC